MLRIIPVLDLKSGHAVQARAGRRDDYRPLRSALRAGSDPIILAQSVRDTFGLDDLYLADLDAIAGAAPALDLYEKLVGLGLRLWVDAGLRDGSGVAAISEKGITRAVVGLETVAGPDGLRSALGAADLTRLAFSLDLRDGRPIIAPGADWGTNDPREIAARVVEYGVETVILLDVARVGMGTGLGTLPLLNRLSAEFPNVRWVAGGGVARSADLDAIERAGASAALVGSALHNGRLVQDWNPRTV